MTQDSNEVEKEIKKEDIVNKNSVIEIDYNSYSPQELLQHLSELITTENIYSVAKNVDTIKAVFYKKINAEKDVHKAEYIKNEGSKE